MFYQTWLPAFKLIFVLVTVTCLTNYTFGQTKPPALKPKVYNYTHFTSDSQLAATIGGDEQPDNMATLNSNATEVIEKRTANTKYYTDKSNPGKFFQLFSFGGNLNYKKNGKWQTVDTRLHPAGKNIFAANAQHEPVGFDMLKKASYIVGASGPAYFNNWNLIGLKAGVQTVLAKANWANYTAGDDGLMIHDIFPGIDAEMTVQAGAVKTNFIIRKNSFPDAEEFIFRDSFATNGISGKLSTDGEGGNKAIFYINGKAALKVNRAIVFTEKNGAANYANLGYTVNNNQLSFSVKTDFINKHLQTGAVIIDPLVEGIGTLEQNAITGSMNCGSSANYCGYNFTVPTPAKATFTNVYLKWGFYASAPSGQNQGFFIVKSSNCSTGSIGVVNPSVNTGQGSVSTQGSFIPISSLLNCLPPPSCQSQNIPFELGFYNTYCGAGTGCSDTYVRANEPLVIKIEGHTLEVQSITAPFTICKGASATVNVSARYGVPPYTYLWSTGATGTSINVSPTATTTYSATITDACGTTATGDCKVTVNPIPVIQSVNSNGPLCAGSQLVLNTPAVNGATYSWAGPNNFSSASQSPAISGVTPSQSGTYTLRITVNGCTSPPVSTNVEISTPITPSVSISASATTVCAGTNVTFTATPVNGGATPAYQWLLNGVNTGTNSNTYSSAQLNDNDVVSCILTSSAGCTSSPTAKANDVTIKVNPVSIPQVNITANTATTICAGIGVTFTAIAINGGTAPSFQWQVNGVNAGANSNSYTTTGLNDNDVVTCVLTSNAICAVIPTATSNSIKFTVVPLVTPAVSISASASAICPGTQVIFTATVVNGGTTPAYQWALNGTNVGTNSNAFTSNSLSNNDVVTCTLTSNITCVTSPTAISNTVRMLVSVPVTPTIQITASSANVCAGTPVRFTAAVTNEGSTPVYQWKLNGVNTGTNSPTFNSSTLANSDIVSCVLTSSVGCVTSQTAISGNITMIVNPVLVPAVSISASANNICEGLPINFTASAVNCGNTPTYNWYVNGSRVGTNSNSFNTTTLRNADVVTCRVTPQAGGCYTQNEVISNELPVTINAVPVVSAGRDTVVFKGSSFTLNGYASGSIATYQWSPSTYLSSTNIPNPVITPLLTTKYTLRAISTANCENFAEITVSVLSKIEIPNTFTPNGDGVNDTWVIKGLSDYKGAVVNVYNRYGQQVFHTTGYKQWDETQSTKPLPAATYYYVIDPKNKTAPLAGWVVILR